MANNNHICVFDFETGGINVERTTEGKEAEPLQIGALILHPKTLKVVDTYESLIQPLRPELVEEGALKINHLTLDQVKSARHPKVVWKEFTSWLKQYQKKDSPWDYPIAAGYNILEFDMHIINNLCDDYGPKKSDRGSKIEKQAVFHRMYKLDLMHEAWKLMENSECLSDYSESKKHDLKLTTLSNFLGLTFDDAHTALGDVRVTAAILVRILKLNRRMIGDGITTSFRNAFQGATAQEYLDSL